MNMSLFIPFIIRSERTFRISAAGKKRTVAAAQTDGQGLGAARTFEVRGPACALQVGHPFAGGLQGLLKRSVEIAQKMLSAASSMFYLVEIFFHISGKFHVHNVRKIR